MLIFLSVVIIFFVCCSNLNVKKPGAVENKAMILEVWQLDMVEGGQGSRKNFLEKVARGFEKKNSKVLVSIVNETVSSAEGKFKNGIFPDVISYSAGLEGFFSKAQTINSSNKLDCAYNKKNFAVAWAFGGYCFIVKKGSDVTKIEECVVSQSEFSLPMFAYYSSDYRFNKVEVFEPKLAYQEFINRKDAALLGTQRDLYRLKNRNLECDFYTVNSFSDIVQYASIISEEKDRIEKSREFIHYLLTDGQALVSEIGLMPITLEKKDDSLIYEMSLGNTFSTISVFLGKQTIKNAQQSMLESSLGDKEKILYIKNLVK